MTKPSPVPPPEPDPVVADETFSVLFSGRARVLFGVAHDHLNEAEQLAKAADDPDATLAYLCAARALVYALAGLTSAFLGEKR